MTSQKKNRRHGQLFVFKKEKLFFSFLYLRLWCQKFVSECFFHRLQDIVHLEPKQNKETNLPQHCIPCPLLQWLNLILKLVLHSKKKQIHQNYAKILDLKKEKMIQKCGRKLNTSSVGAFLLLLDFQTFYLFHFLMCED